MHGPNQSAGPPMSLVCLPCAPQSRERPPTSPPRPVTASASLRSRPGVSSEKQVDCDASHVVLKAASADISAVRGYRPASAHRQRAAWAGPRNEQARGQQDGKEKKLASQRQGPHYWCACRPVCQRSAGRCLVASAVRSNPRQLMHALGRSHRSVDTGLPVSVSVRP